MLEPADREVIACRTCRDHGWVAAGKKDIKCPECQSWDDEQREAIRRAATRDRAEKPAIGLADLTAEERALVAQWRIDHPRVHELTLLTWIEGRRYDPEKDPEFMAEARKRFKKWQFLRNVHDGPEPSWARHALETGDTTDLSKTDREYVETLRRG